MVCFLLLPHSFSLGTSSLLTQCFVIWTEDVWSDFDNEEIDHAIALSLADEDQRAVAEEEQKASDEEDQRAVAEEDHQEAPEEKDHKGKKVIGELHGHKTWDVPF